MSTLEVGYHDVPPGKLAAVITTLEMTSRITTKDRALPDGIALRQVQPDVAWYRDVYKRVGALEWLWFARLRLDDDALHPILADPSTTYFTLSKDGQDHALMELDFRTSGACELVYFGLTPELIGTGSGRALMNEAIAQAWSRPIERFFLHTCTLDSPQALSFYQRSGFKPISRRIEIADDPRLLGTLPETAAPHIPLIPG